MSVDYPMPVDRGEWEHLLALAAGRTVKLSHVTAEKLRPPNYGGPSYLAHIPAALYLGMPCMYDEDVPDGMVRIDPPDEEDRT